MLKLEIAKLLDRHLHDTRHALVGDGLAIDRGHSLSVNALRGHLAEFGVIAAKAISHIDELVERAAADLPAMVLATRWRFSCAIAVSGAAIDDLERAIVADRRRDPVSRLTASVSASARSPLRRFWLARQIRTPSKSGRDFAAWLGVTPKQNSTGGKVAISASVLQVGAYLGLTELYRAALPP